MKGDPHPWATDLELLYSQVWTRLVRGVRDRHAASRHTTLATVTKDGMPRARTVVLRHADASTRTLEVHTDLHSAKMQGLSLIPFAALHVWDQSAHLQIRLETGVTIVTGDDVAGTWARVPEPARLSYGGKPAPGEPIKDGLDYVKSAQSGRFAVIQLHVLAIDALHLGKDHRRARFERAGNWQGQWLVP